MIGVIRILTVMSIIGVYCVALSACDDKKNSTKTHQYVKQIKKRYSNEKPVAVTIKNIAQQSYRFANKRSPFALLKKNAEAKKHYPNAILSDYDIQSLKLVGILSEDKKNWAMITTPDGKLYKITIGARVGNNYALVTQINQNNVEFREDDAGSNKSKPRDVLLTIQEPQ